MSISITPICSSLALFTARHQYAKSPIVFYLHFNKMCFFVLTTITPLFVTLLRLHTAAQYTEVLSSTNESISPYIFGDIAERGISKLSDRCAIAANCLDYRAMIHTKAFELKERNSPSLIILALYLMNGEILRNNRPVKDTSRLTVFEFLKEYSFKKFTPPRAVPKLTYNKSCRFVDPRLTDRGVEVSGHLWRLSKRIGPEDYALSSDYPEERQSHGLWDLANLLGSGELGASYPLANEISGFLQESPQGEKTFSMWYKEIMKGEIEAAIDAGKYFRLACIVDEHDNDASYRGIFVEDYPEDTGEAYVFTSFSEGGRSWKDIHKYVSIEVDLDDDEVTSSLFMRRWRNGLVFFTDEPTRSFVFPWPDGLTI